MLMPTGEYMWRRRPVRHGDLRDLRSILRPVDPADLYSTMQLLCTQSHAENHSGLN